jgi:hypothetical protein
MSKVRTVPEVVLASTSRAQDAGYLALADVAAVTEELVVDYRLVGGHMVALLVAVYSVTGVPERETADADLGAHFAVAGDERLVQALKERGYTQPGASNRFVRTDESGPELVIDVLAPSYSGRHETNQRHGSLYLDEIPGLALALAQEPVVVEVEARLSDGRLLAMTVRIPAPLPALCLKLLSYGSRRAAKDALDIWRLLAVCHAAGVRPDAWGTHGAQRDASRELQEFARLGSFGLRQATTDTATQARIRAIAAAVAPRAVG